MKGKGISKQFQKLEKGDRVVLKVDKSKPYYFHKRARGSIGEIEGKRGKAYIVKVKERNRVKRHIVTPTHLDKIK